MKAVTLNQLVFMLFIRTVQRDLADSRQQWFSFFYSVQLLFFSALKLKRYIQVKLKEDNVLNAHSYIILI